MGVFDRIEQRASQLSSAAQWQMDVGSGAAGSSTAAGVDVNANIARTLTAVWACQSLISDGIASLPIDVIRLQKGKKVTLDASNGRPKWVDYPNPFDTPYTFWHKVAISLLGEGGNAYIRVIRNSDEKIDSLWVLDPTACEVDEDSREPLVHVSSNSGDGRTSARAYGPDELLHIPAFTIPGLRKGLSVIDNAKEAIGLGLAAEEFGARFFSQGTTMSGIIQHPGVPKPGELAAMRGLFKKSHSGMKNSHAVGILTGNATWQNISVTPEQAQFLETRRFQNLQVAQLYRVPPHMIDPTVQSSWGSGVEEQNSFFAEYTLVPWLTRIEQAFSRLMPNGTTLKFNLMGRLRARTAERFQAYVAAVNNGIMSLDEVRLQEDLEPIPDDLGSKFVRPLNVNELGAPPPEKKPQGDPPQKEPAKSDPPKGS